jgi:hypothetical protein
MPRPVIYFIALFLVFNSCQDEEDTVTVLTVRVEAGEIFNYVENWIFISDDDGRLLDIWEARNNSTHQFKAGAKRGTVNVTYFYGTPDFQSMTTYTRVPADKTLKLKMSYAYPYNYSPTDVIGQGYVVVKNFTGASFPPAAFSFSDGKWGGNLISDFQQEDQTVTFRILLSRDADSVLVTSYREGAPVYKYIDAPEPQDTISLDFSDFLLQDHVIDLKAHGYTIGGITGIRTDDGNIARYLLTDTYMTQQNFEPSANPMLGYIDGFDAYETSLNQAGSVNKRNISYYKYGAPPESIAPPAFESFLSENSSRSVTSTINIPYSYKAATWNAGRRNLRISWFVFSENGDEFLLPDVPSQIIDLYPQFHHSNMDLQDVTYYQHLDGKSYGDFLDGLTGNPRPDKEVFTIRIAR